MTNLNLRVLIVEDEIMISEMLKEMLEAEEVNDIHVASDYSTALQLLANNTYDLAFLDVNIGEGKTGIDLGEFIRSRFKICIVFTTSFSDAATLQSIAALRPEMYISKPYRVGDIRAAIQIVKSNLVERRSLEIKTGGEVVKVPMHTILYIKTDNIYLSIYTDNKKYLVRSTLENFLDEYKNVGLVKVHRSYAVAIDRVTKYTDGVIYIGEEEIPVSKANRKEIQELFNSVQASN